MKIVQDVYWGLNEKDEVVIDVEEIRKEFEHKLSTIVQEKEGFSENVMEDKYGQRLYTIRYRPIY